MTVTWLEAPETRHHRARKAVEIAFRETFGRSPTLSEAQGVQVIALIESGYGAGWRDDSPNCPNSDCSGSNNWGAIITKACPNGGRTTAPVPNVIPKCDPGSSFLHRDSYPDGTACWQCFRKYPTAAAGAAHLVRELYKRRRGVFAAASRGDLEGVAAGMFDTGYFTGFGPNRKTKIMWQVKRMKEGIGTITKAMNEPAALNGIPGPPGWVMVAIGAGIAAVTFRYWRGYVGI